MTKVIKFFDLDLALYLDLEKELVNEFKYYKKLIFKQFSFLNGFTSKNAYNEYLKLLKQAKHNQNNLLNRLRKRLNIKTITDFNN